MSCTKAMLVALLRKIRRELDECGDIDCAKSLLNTYIAAIEEKTYRELETEIFR